MDVDDHHSPRLEDDADLPRHQRKRPTMLSMELVDTPSSETTPVLGSMGDSSSSSSSSSGARASTSPMGKIRMVSEKLGSSVYGKKKKDKDKKKRSSSSPSMARAANAFSSSSSPPSFSSSSHSNLTVVTRLTPTRSSAANSNVRVSSPLSKELGPKSSSSGGNSSNSSSNSSSSGNSNDGGGKLTRTLSGSSLKKKHSSPLGEADLQDLALDQSKNEYCDSMQGGNYDTKTDDDDDEERKEEACFSPRVGGGSSSSSSSSSIRCGGMFRPLSPLVMPMLRSPRMRRVLGEENADKVATLFEGKDSPTHQQQQQQQQQQPQQQSPSPSSSSTSSPRSGANTISSLAKKMVQASVHAMSSSSSSSSSSSTQVVAPKPLRADAPLVLLPTSPPPSSFAHVQPYIPASVAAATAAAVTATSSSTQHQLHPRKTSSVSFSVPLPSALQQNFTVALGLCLLACGFSQAGLEWYTMNLGSDYSTWWAGSICALLGLATMAAQKKRRGSSTTTTSSSSSSSSVMAALQEWATVLLHVSYAFLVVGGAVAVVAALFLDLKLLDRLEQTDMCGASTDKLVLDNGLVLSETLGNACGFSSGCACVQFTHPLPAGDVACMNFARSSAAACPNIPFAIAGMVRVSVWLMGGLLFFMTVLMLRARGSVIGACGERGGRSSGSGSFSRRRSGNIRWRNEEEGPVVSSFGSSKVRSMSVASRRRLKAQEQQQREMRKRQQKSWWQTGDEDSSSDEEEGEEEEEEEGGGEGMAGMTMGSEGHSASRSGGGRSLMLTPIPECNTPQPEEETDGSSRGGGGGGGGGGGSQGKEEGNSDDDGDDDDDEQVAPPRRRQDIVYI